MTERFAYHPDVQDAWDLYLIAKDYAQKTRNLNDGVTAAKLWRRFISLYDQSITPEDDNAIAYLPSAKTQICRREAR